MLAEQVHGLRERGARRASSDRCWGTEHGHRMRAYPPGWTRRSCRDPVAPQDSGSVVPR